MAHEYPDFEKELKEVIKELDTDGHGARYDLLMKRAEKERWNVERVNEVIGELIDEGEVYEPLLGRLKVA